MTIGRIPALAILPATLLFLLLARGLLVGYGKKKLVSLIRKTKLWNQLHFFSFMVHGTEPGAGKNSFHSCKLKVMSSLLLISLDWEMIQPPLTRLLWKDMFNIFFP
jgi:hypothetical protein